MKKSIYNNVNLNTFETPLKAFEYYIYMLKNNKESSVYPRELREFHKGLVIGLCFYLNKSIDDLNLDNI